MQTQDVVYVDRGGGRTSSFTDAMADTVQQLARQGYEIVSVVPNVGLGETIGVWLFVRQRG